MRVLRGPVRAALAAMAVVAAFRIGSVWLVDQPGYTDAHYYFAAAQRLAAGHGLSIDLVWNFLEAPDFAPLPVPSHRFWMPLATVLQAGGIAALGWALEPFRAAQAVTLVVALGIPVATYVAARRIGLAGAAAALAAGVAGLGGAYAAAWSSLDNFAPVALLATIALVSLSGIERRDARAALVCGAALGGLVLARADGAIYLLALLPSLRVAPRHVAFAVVAALLIALPWYVRNAALGFPEGQFARTALLLRYEDFFRVEAPDPAAYFAQPFQAISAKLAALATNAATYLISTFVLLGPLALWRAFRTGRSEPLARGWLVVAVALYLVHSLVFTLHSTRGAYAHSLAGLVPIAVALGIAGGRDVLIRFAPRARTLAASALGAGALALSAYALIAWASQFGPPAAARRQVAEAVIPPALVIDAAAWRPIVDGAALVTPAEGLSAAREVARRYGARTLVLEPAHFSAYNHLYEGIERVPWLELVASESGIVIWRIVSP